MQKTITDSTRISVLEARIIADLCTGNFTVDLSPSVFIGSGATNVLGAKVQIVNPYGVAVKNYAAVGYDIVPPMDGVITFPIPTKTGNFQYGLYVFTIQLFDSNGNVYTIEDDVSICEPNPKDKTKKYGTLNADINANCKEGKVTIVVNEPPVYKGKAFETKVQTITLEYPTGSGLAPLVSNLNSFSVALYEGVHKVTGDVCVTYNLGDNVYAKIPYKIKCSKNILCLIDLCCVFDRIKELNDQLASCKTEAEKQNISNTIVDALRLETTIRLGGDCGEDVSPYIEELEILLGCKCTCSATEGTPISNTTPVLDFDLTGCGFIKTTVGLTTIFEVNNYAYVVAVNPANNSILTFSNATLNGCVQTQTLTFNVAGAYAAMKTVVTDTADYTFWGNIVKQAYTPSADVLACLGLTTTTYAALSYSQYQELILNKMCGCCQGASCSARISHQVLTAKGSQELFEWRNDAGVYSTDIYVDGELAATVLYPAASYLANIDTSLITHTYSLVAKCSNGAQGNTLAGNFTNLGCIDIMPPTLSSNNVVGATCPYNLSSLTSAPPAGYSIEWHNQNNRNQASLVPNIASVSSGTYYAFTVLDSNQCSSASSSVIIACTVVGNCTEPLSLNVAESGGGNVVISFSPAATPPPSYLVKRRLASTTDVDANYTTIGTPIYNSGMGMFNISDAGAANNTLYVWKAESQCPDGSRPAALFTFAKVICPTVALTPATNQVTYSFTNSGGTIDKYEVVLTNDIGNSVISTQTVLPAFASPITGVFTGIEPGTNYKVFLRTYIGVYSKTCGVNAFTTTSGSGTNPLMVVIDRVGSVNGTLTAQITGGTAPYSYVFHIDGLGDCEAHTIATASGTSADGINISTAFTTTPYTGTYYRCYILVADSAADDVSSNVSTIPACLVPETLIKLKDGTDVELGKLAVGIELFGLHNKIEGYKTFTVDKLFVINGGLLKCSEGHFHPLQDGSLKQTAELKKGDKLSTFNDGTIEIYTIEQMEGKFDVVDIATTTGLYYANSVLTHNKINCP